MKRLLPLIFLVLGLAAGVGGGLLFGPSPAGEKTNAAETGSGDAASREDAVTETAGSGQDHADDATGDPDGFEYLKFNKQFVVPLLKRGDVIGLAMVGLSLEAVPGLGERFHEIEPKLRDGFLQVLFDHANMGGFDGAFTESGKLNPLRGALLEVAQNALGVDRIRSVLIVDIARQARN